MHTWNTAPTNTCHKTLRAGSKPVNVKACRLHRGPRRSTAQVVTAATLSSSSDGAVQGSNSGRAERANDLGSSTSSTSTVSSTTGRESAQEQPTQSPLAFLLQRKPAIARKALSTGSSSEAIEVLLQEKADLALKEDDCVLLMNGALERNNVQLSMSIHESMLRARQGRPMTSTVDSSFPWPPASLQSTCSLVLSLCKQLAIDQAMQVLTDIRIQGLPRNDAVGFGKVITSPLAPKQTLTVVQPQEGAKLVADAFSRYEYEVFSGSVISVKSEALQPNVNLLYKALRALGILRKAAPAAIHEFVVQAPDGVSRTFRVSTETADVPAQVSERLTLVCAPSTAMAKDPRRKRQAGVFSSDPPDTKPGEALTATNHATNIITELLPPPISASQGTIPGWVLPAVVLAAGGDAASSLLDPTYPALIAAAAASVVSTSVASNRVLLPKLKQLPEKAVNVEYTRQRLLGQYAQLANKFESVMNESREDVRVLARLWQLANKMQSVGTAAAASYAARMDRVAAARTSLEERLVKKMELLDGYSKVMNMIEIEVEMDIEVPAAELAGIEEQMVRLIELEGLQDEWRVQAEARDEVERLLRST